MDKTDKPDIADASTEKSTSESPSAPTNGGSDPLKKKGDPVGKNSGTPGPINT